LLQEIINNDLNLINKNITQINSNLKLFEKETIILINEENENKINSYKVHVNNVNLKKNNKIEDNINKEPLKFKNPLKKELLISPSSKLQSLTYPSLRTIKGTLLSRGTKTISLVKTEIDKIKNNYRLINDPIENKVISNNLNKNFLSTNINSIYTFSSFLTESKLNIFSFNKNNYNSKIIKSASLLLKSFFLGLKCLISTPVYIITPDKVVILLFFFWKKRSFFKKLKIISRINKNKSYFLRIKKIINNNKIINKTYPINTKSKNIINDNNEIKLKEKNNFNLLQDFIKEQGKLQYNNLRINNFKMENSLIKKFTKIKTKLDLGLFISQINLNSISTSPWIFKNKMSQFENDKQLNFNVPFLGAGIYKLINSNIKRFFSNYKFKKYFNHIGSLLNKIFNNNIEIKLVRLYYPFYDSNILTQILGINSKKIKFINMIKILNIKAKIYKLKDLIKKNKFSIRPDHLKGTGSVSSFLSGIKIKKAGRLKIERIIPRYTVKTVQIGSFARDKVNFMETSRYTNKTKKGAFSFTVSISHVF
jgi:hypothetical protein